jgi:hypothetical protein
MAEGGEHDPVRIAAVLQLLRLESEARVRRQSVGFYSNRLNEVIAESDKAAAALAALTAALGDVSDAERIAAGGTVSDQGTRMQHHMQETFRDYAAITRRDAKTQRAFGDALGALWQRFRPGRRA